jgi:hypothetical protein
MDRTTLTLAVDSTQVGTAAAAFDRFVNAGNAAASSAGRVTSAALAQGRSIAQTLVPALNTGINRTRTLAETQTALGQDAARQVAQSPAVRAQSGFAAGTSPQIAAAPRAHPAPTQGVSVAGATDLSRLTGGASSARAAIERLTTAARNDRNALVQLTPAAAAAAGSYRQLATTPIRLNAEQGLSAASAALGNLSDRAANARRAIADLNRAAPSAPQASGAPLNPGVPLTPASNQGAANAFTAAASAAARGTTATNAFTAAQGRAAEAAQHLAEANARNEAANARLAVAIQRAAAAQTAFDNASRTPGNADAVAQAQTRLQSAQAAVSVATANVARSHRAAADAAERHRIALQATGRQSTLTANQTQQLHFQLHDFFVQVASGGSPLTAFIQQGSQLSGTFGGTGGAVRAVLSLLTPTTIAFGAAAVAVGGFALALSKAESAARDLNAVQAQLAGTGRKGLFSDAELREYLVKLSELPDVTRDTAAAIVTELAKVHEIGGSLFKDLAALSVDYAKATGKEAPEAARELAKAFADPKRGAEQLDAALGSLSSSQLLQIEQLSRLGDKAGAQKVLLEALTTAVKGLADNAMTPLQKSVDSLGNAWDRAMRSMEASNGLRNINALLGRTVDGVRYLIENIDKIGGLGTVGLSMIPGGQAGALANAVTSRFGSAATGKREVSGKITPPPNAVVAATAKPGAAPAPKTVAEIDKEIKASIEAAKSYQSQAGKIEDLTDKRKRFNTALKQSISLYGKDSEQAKTFRDAIAGVDEQIASARKKGGSEASQVLRNQLQADLKTINDVFEKQRDAYQFQNAFVENAYRAGTLSLGELMEQRRETIENTAKAQIEALNQEQTRLEQAFKQEKDPSTRVQLRTRINEIDVDREKTETRKKNDLALLNQEKTASFKALNDQVVSYRANLLQMQGDEAGAAALRAQLAIESAKVLNAQSDKVPGVGKVDVDGLTRAIALTDRYNDLQRQTSLLASDSARAEEAYLLAAEQSGRSLFETERGLYVLRSQELEQLGALALKAKELAEVSTDPRIKAMAADLALAYAKAADAIDPALRRLRSAQAELAAGLANTAGQAPSAFIEQYSKRRQDASDDIKRQQDEYSRKIDMLEGYLATTQDKQDKARLRERIKAEEAKRDSVKGESRGGSVLKAINSAVVQPMAAQVFNTVNKLLITDPLQAYLQNQLKGLTEGNGLFAGFFKDALGIKADPKELAQQQQTAAIQASTSAVDALRIAAENAANALNKPLIGGAAQEGQPASAGGVIRQIGAQGGADSTRPPPVDSELVGMQSTASSASESLLDARSSAQVFGDTAKSAATMVSALASSASKGGSSLGVLPSIVSMFQSAVMAMQASSATSGSSGGIFGAIAGLFGKSSSASSYEAAVASSGIFHSGGIVGQPPATRNVSMSLFAGAPRYHTGGIVGKAADKAAKLAHNEVAAILMGGPKGKREEVLTADDPRHRDNLGMSIVARIMAESKHEGLRVRGARELGGPVSAGGMYRVNEKGPELLQVAGKQYLMMGSQGGKVDPNSAIGKGGDTTVVHVNVTPPPGGSTASAAQWGAMAGRHIQRSMRRNT